MAINMLGRKNEIAKKVTIVNKLRISSAILGVMAILSVPGCFDSNTADAPPSLKPPPPPPNCIEIGALVYDNWTKSAAGGQDALPSGEANVDYLRCKACHGWDQLGIEGGYVRRTREATRPNAGAGDTINTTTRNISGGIEGEASAITQSMVLQKGSGRSFAEGSLAWDGGSQTGYAAGNLHPDFAAAGGLSADQTLCVTKFLNDSDAKASKVFSGIDTSTNPVGYTVVASADASKGELRYGNFCVSCHGDAMQNSDTASNDLPGKGGVIAYLRKDGKASELMHKIHWGVPGTSMTRTQLGNPSSADVADVIAYLQAIIVDGLPKAFDDEMTTDIDTTVAIPVLDNDSDANGDVLIVTAFDPTGTQGGTVSDNGDGILNYTPTASFEGMDTFTYTISDADNNEATATVTVIVGNASLVKGKAFFTDNCAICHAAGSDDTSVAFNATDLALQANPLVTDLSVYGGSYELMGVYSDVPQTTIDDLKAYLDTL